jgi:hypothetical protein
MSNEERKEPHEYPQPVYSPRFFEHPSEAYARGVQDGINWACNEANRRDSPEGYRASLALERTRSALAGARTAIRRLEERISRDNYRDDMGR